MNAKVKSIFTRINLLICLILCVIEAGALEKDQLHTEINSNKYPQYFQKEFQLVDPQGDLALIDLSLKIRNHLFLWIFQTENYSEYLTEILNYQGSDQCDIVPSDCNMDSKNIYSPFLASNIPPIDQDETLAHWITIINDQKYGKNKIIPVEGMTHDWSAEFLKNYFNPLSYDPIDISFPKLLLVLAFGVSSRFTITGNENTLLQLCLQQEKNSITLDWIFEQSYLINNGNIYNTLLTIENILSKEYLNANREDLPLTKRLKSIVKGTGDDRDRFGTWYHFWGMVLYGYYKGYSSSVYRAEVVADLETALANIISDQRNQQKTHINVQGARLGATLKGIVRDLENSPFYHGVKSVD